jgi:hypothetical protein
MDVLRTHPLVIDRGEILKNAWYRPPVEVLQNLLAPEAENPAQARPQ